MRNYYFRCEKTGQTHRVEWAPTLQDALLELPAEWLRSYLRGDCLWSLDMIEWYCPPHLA